MKRYMHLTPLLVVIAAGCGSTTAEPLPTDDRCLLPIDPGPCDAAIRAYGFDASIGDCVEFSYGGCGGNDNNFSTYFACMQICAEAPVACGGIGGATCSADEYCHFDNNTCGAGDVQGICRARPDVCTEEYNPVCGCDGSTYGNRCSARSAGVDIVSVGECPPDEPTMCGGFSGQTCKSTEFCDFLEDGCGVADGSGLCLARPQGCTREYAPVCGCDGQTYANLCEAQRAGFDASFSGACERATLTCPDNSRDTIIQAAANRFGECGVACSSELSITASPILVIGACDGASVEVCDNGPNPICTSAAGGLTRLGHERARILADGLRGVTLESVYGCPDCADGGASSIVLVRDNATFEVTYEFGAPPAVLAGADAFVQSLLQSLRNCQSSPYIEVRQGCAPR